MIKMLWLLALLIGSVYLGVKLQGDPGYVLISIKHWTLESTVWVFLAAVILLFAMLHLFFASYHKTMHIPDSWAIWRKKRKHRHARTKTTQGLIAFSEGYWFEAKKQLIDALPNSETPLINYLTAARAAQELGNSKERDQYLRAAQRAMPDAKIAVELTQAQLQLAHQQFEQALATLRHLHDLAPKHPYVLKLLAHLYEATSDWAHLIELLPRLKKARAIDAKALLKLSQKAYCGHIQNFAEEANFEGLELALKKLPSALKNNSEIMASYARTLLKQDKTVQAEVCLKRAMQKELTPELIDIYAALPAETARSNFIEALLKNQTPHKAELHYCLGVIFKKQQLFGKAQAQLEESVALQKNAKTYQALGELFEELQDTHAAFDAYKEGINI